MRDVRRGICVSAAAERHHSPGIDALLIAVEGAAPGVLADFRIDLGLERGAELRWITNGIGLTESS